MAVNYAEKYSSKVDERFKLGARTTEAVNNDYDWEGTSAIKVYSVETSALNDYKTTGTNRYGEPDELGNKTQTMVLSQDKSFTFTIDRKSHDDTQMVMEAGKALQREIDEVIIPYIDKYRLDRMSKAVGSGGTGAITKTNAYSSFLDGTATLDEAKVPDVGRLCYVSTDFYKKIKLDDNFIKASDLAESMLISGQIGEIDGVRIMKGAGIMPAGVDFIICHPLVTTSPIKLLDYFIHENPPGINGWLVEGRVRFDAFVRAAKKEAIYVHSATAITADGTADYDEPEDEEND